MAMQLGQQGDDDEVIASINTTPLVDVMLVLLIIFLITIPVVTTSIAVQLPKERIEVREAKAETIVVSIDQAGTIYWYDTPLKDSAALAAKLKPIAALRPQPDVHIRGDMAADFAPFGKVLQACREAGVSKIAFVTEPPARQ